MKKYLPKKIKIAIAENHLLVRRTLISFLSNYKDYEVVGDFSNGKELIDSLKNLLIEPDIILLDISMPIMNGDEALGIIRKRFTSIKVIMISMYDEPELVLDLITKGANAFISKNGEPEELIKAINTVYEDGHYFDKNTTHIMHQKLTLKKPNNPFIDNTSLSDREIAVMKEICEGHTNKIISEHLFISSRTVDFHKANIYRKINSKKITDVLKYALKNGIVQMSSHNH